MQVLFLLDAHNDYIYALLKEWIDQYAMGRSYRQVRLDLSDDREGIDISELLQTLSLPPQTLYCPLRIAWLPSNNAIHSGPRIRDFVFGDPRRPSARRCRRILRKMPERVHPIIGKPDSLESLRARFSRKYGRDSATEPESFSTFTARQAAIVLDVSERRLQGGRYKVPRYVAESLRNNRSFNEALDALADKSGESKSTLMKRANAYMKEMISVPSTFWLDVSARFASFCLGLGYEPKIVVSPSALEELRKVVRENPSIMLWTHKTYLDGFVVPKVMYDNDFPMPHMFGGANMKMPALGMLGQRAGTIFIRRSFQDDEVYKLTLRQYIGYLMEKRFPMNWSFEGTRSRMGKLMPPKYGLLKYVLEACHASDARNIHIVPVTISYDLIRDVEEYATEQTGRGKGAETLRWFFGYVRSLSRPMGKIYMDIGEPVVLEQAPEPGDKLALSKIAFEVAVEANRVTPITFSSLVTMSLLGAAPRALTEEEIATDLRKLLVWAEERKLRISEDFRRDFADQMEGLMGIMISEGIVTRYDEGPQTVFGLAQNQQPVASYYRNTVVHFFVNKAIIELALLKASEVEAEAALNVFWREVDALRDLFKFEFFYSPTEEFHQEIREELGRIDPQWEDVLQQGRVETGWLLKHMDPLVAHVALLTYAEAYAIVADLLEEMPAEESLQSKDCANKAFKLGRQLYLQRRISSEASIGKQLFKNAYQLMEHRKLTSGSAAGDECSAVAERRSSQAHEIRDILRRIEIIRNLGNVGARQLATQTQSRNNMQLPSGAPTA
nr:glycerol-3-phosphate 1-O-acyltransferase [Spongiibacter thalassae]